MISTEIVLRFAQAFKSLNIPYMLVGSYSTNLYGRPRSTHDADFVIELPGHSIESLRAELGPEFRFDPQMSFETITGTMRYIVVHPASAFKVELFLMSDDPHDRSRFSRRQLMDFDGTPVWLPSPEDVIVTKLRWSKGGRRAKDVTDVKQVLEVQFGKLDLAYVRHWCDQHGTRDIFEKLHEDARLFVQGS